MNTFGYKIVEKDRHEISPIVMAALDQQRPLEVGLYFGNEDAWNFLRTALYNARIPINTHLDHGQLSVFTISANESLLRQQIEQSLSIGSTYSVTHVHRSPTTQRPSQLPRLAEHLSEQLYFFDRVCGDYDYDIHVENTFHNLTFYRWFFELVAELDLKHIHHCFDLGHAKIWSKETLPEWFIWLRDFEANGSRIHFHLHTNDGTADQHLSFVEAQTLQMTDPDGYTVKWNYFDVLRELRDRFPNSRKVFEVKPRYALENMALIESKMGE